MKTLIFFILFLASLGRVAAESFRTDINPALIYWQAFGEWPSLSDEEQAYVNTNGWRNASDQHSAQLMAKYDNAFKLIRRAAKSKVPCDWGYDLTDGPEALLPGLAKAKAVAQTARWRASVHLQRGDQTAAREELMGAFALGRNVSKDGILISALVQYAIENIVTWAIAENFYQFSPETLKQMAAEIEASPALGTVAQCIPLERHSFRDWLVRNVQEIQKNTSSNETAMAQFRELINRLINSGENPDPGQAEKIIQAAGSTPDQVITYVKELDAFYDEANALMKQPYAEFRARINAFNERVANHPNLLAHLFFPVLEKCRNKEFAANITTAMLKTAIEYRLSGEAALKQAIDPVLKEPFAFRRFLFSGEDRGLELRSKFDGRGFEEALIFVEKPGPSFQVIGKNVGKAVN